MVPLMHTSSHYTRGRLARFGGAGKNLSSTSCARRCILGGPHSVGVKTINVRSRAMRSYHY
jgi:hypothetical protein